MITGMSKPTLACSHHVQTMLIHLWQESIGFAAFWMRVTSRTMFSSVPKSLSSIVMIESYKTFNMSTIKQVIITSGSQLNHY
jgi:hypothetical protein